MQGKSNGSLKRSTWYGDRVEQKHRAAEGYRNADPFGAKDIYKCPRCGDKMRLTRRSPFPDHANRYEHQTFTCRNCRFEIQRSVDEHGNRHG
jgi:uncharacterized protein with PIN domain